MLIGLLIGIEIDEKNKWWNPFSNIIFFLQEATKNKKVIRNDLDNLCVCISIQVSLSFFFWLSHNECDANITLTIMWLFFSSNTIAIIIQQIIIIIIITTIRIGLVMMMMMTMMRMMKSNPFWFIVLFFLRRLCFYTCLDLDVLDQKNCSKKIKGERKKISDNYTHNNYTFFSDQQSKVKNRDYKQTKTKYRDIFSGKK